MIPAYRALTDEASAMAASSAAELVVLLSEMRGKLHSVLTPEQRQRFRELHGIPSRGKIRGIIASGSGFAVTLSDLLESFFERIGRWKSPFMKPLSISIIRQPSAR